MSKAKTTQAKKAKPPTKKPAGHALGKPVTTMTALATKAHADRKETIRAKTDQAKKNALIDPVSMDRFWALIEKSRRGTDGDADVQLENIKRLLVALSPDQILEWGRCFSIAVRAAYRWDVWGAAYIINGGCSDDGFDYFLGWLISRGRKQYDKALVDPQSAADGLEEGDVELEGMWTVASRAWEEKTGQSAEAFHAVEQRVPRILQGKAWEEEEVYERFPKLAKKFS